jgi:hypothetical protein
MLVEACFELGHTCLELCQLLLLLANDREQGADEVAHGAGGHAPFVTGNSRGWCRVAHADSMSGVGALVKLVRSRHHAAAP